MVVITSSALVVGRLGWSWSPLLMSRWWWCWCWCSILVSGHRPGGGRIIDAQGMGHPGGCRCCRSCPGGGGSEWVPRFPSPAAPPPRRDSPASKAPLQGFGEVVKPGTAYTGGSNCLTTWTRHLLGRLQRVSQSSPPAVPCQDPSKAST